MAGKAKFDKEAAFRAIIGRGDVPVKEDLAVESGDTTASPLLDADAKEELKRTNGHESQVQRSYWLDKEIEKALKKKSLEEEKTLTAAINEALRIGLDKYLD